jgi:4'-phosphopantetheinyl transferase
MTLDDLPADIIRRTFGGSGVMTPGHPAPVPILQVVVIELERPVAEVTQLASLLSHGERRRAECYRADRDRRRFIVRRARLRQLLAPLAGCEPAALALVTGNGVKPHLAGRPEIHFSSSSSGDLAAIAFGRSRVGVDLERHAPELATEGVAALFTTRERRAIGAAPPALRTQRFFECWSCKEAYVKAIGTGLATPLHAFDVSDALDRGVAHVDGRDATLALRLLRGPPAHALAVATEVAVMSRHSRGGPDA